MENSLALMTKKHKTGYKELYFSRLIRIEGKDKDALMTLSFNLVFPKYEKKIKKHLSQT